MPAEQRMRAAVLTGPRSATVEWTPRPVAGPGEVRISLEGCGVCASNVTPWEGPDWMVFPTPPGDLGHEGWGTIDAVGAGVQTLAVGDRVAALSFRSYAEYDIAEARACIKLPDELAGMPFPGEPLGCAMNIFRRSDIAAGQTVAIIGIGFLGAVLTRLASDAGARVIAVSRRSSSLDLARAFGADDTIPMDDHSGIIERVRALTGGAVCERAIGAVETLSEMLVWALAASSSPAPIYLPQTRPPSRMGPWKTSRSAAASAPFSRLRSTRSS